jgi:putative ABC transport system permease protein
MPGVAPAMLKEFPEVEAAFRLRKEEFLLGNDSRNIRFREPGVYYTDASILSILDIPLIAGDPKTALTGPWKVIVSETVARKYFGEENPIGKVLTIHDGSQPRPMEVTGVFKDYPANSHLAFTLLISYQSQKTGNYDKAVDVMETSFGWTDFYTYLLLRKGANQQQFAAKLPAFIDRHYNNLPENKSRGDRFSLSIMPLKDIHLLSHYTEEAEANGDGQSVNYLFVIAFLIIAIAWINYINLATARSLERAREVGVRKVLGALRGELIRQFMLESLILNLCALFLAIIITLLVHPLFTRLTGRPLPNFIYLPASYKLYFLGLLAAGTFLSGIYPALVLSRYRPVAVLKGVFKNAAGGQWLRKGLIVGQFAASVSLIAVTLIVYRQLHYMRNQDLGADISQTLVLKGAGSGLTDSAYQDQFSAFKNEMLQVTAVKNVSASSGIMGHEILWSTNWRRLKDGDQQAVNLFHLGVDDDFTKSYGLKFLAGQHFSSSPIANRRKIILNESAVKALNLGSPAQAIGQLVAGGNHWLDSMEVSGVVADYHNEGLQRAIQPLVLLPNMRNRNFYSVKLQGSNAASALVSIKSIWDKYFPADPYDYFFLDEYFNRQYLENQRFGEVFGLFAILAILIACFGLLGLSAYNVLQRTKEIGIRKVLGATVQSLIYTLSKDFLVMVFIAIVIAIPVTWLAMDNWLQHFAYRTNIGWLVFAIAGVLSIMIALVTVGLQAMKASLANPVKSLRTE